MQEILLLYVPVLHQGYLRILKKYSKKVQSLFIVGKEFTEELAYCEKEIRAIEPKTMKVLVESLRLIKSVRILDRKSLAEIKGTHIITAKEGLIKRLVEKYLKSEQVTYDTIFLRWDETHVLAKKPIHYDRISTKKFDQKMIALARVEGKKTSDWWREVGAILVKNGKIITSVHNIHVPSEHSPYAHGDIRDFIPAGKESHIQSALHAEKYVIAEAARKGIALEGVSLYLSIFPCPDCAKVVAYSGIKKCYFAGGHASFDGETILKVNRVELILVKK